MKIYRQQEYARFPIEESEMIVSLGGDGTLLRAAKEAIRYDLPLVGINCGRYGNLCAYRLNEVNSFDPEMLAEIKAMLLETEIDEKKYLSVNDIVIGKDFFGGTIDLETSVNGKTAFRFIGDGLIISTPVGSTGYNRSAKGTILDYSENRYVVTAICPHNIELESTILNKGNTVNVVLKNPKYSASTYIDGTLVAPFEALQIRSSDRYLRLLRKL